MDTTVKIREDEALNIVMQKLGPNYEYKRFIGQGSFSKVYLLRHKILGQMRALKIMDSNYILQTLEKNNVRDIPEKFETIKKRFLNEARSYSKIDHPNVVRIYDVDIISNTSEGHDITYILMQFVEGKNLKNILHENFPLEMDKIMAISKDILDALHCLHEAGIIHRDIKPANIIIEKKSNRAIVIDFGLAKDITNISANAIPEEADRSLGTPVYMSPDQFQISGKIGPGVDLYAFGILLYEMLTGDVPFKGTFGEIVKGHLMAPVPDVREKNPLAPAGIQEIIKKVLEKEPENRYQNAIDLLSDFKKIGHDRSVDDISTETTRDSKKRTKKTLTYAAIFLSILTAAVFFYIYILPPQKIDSLRYKDNFDKATMHYENGQFDEAEYYLREAVKINDTPEAKELDSKVQAGKLLEAMKNDFEELKVAVNLKATIDTKIAECHNFLDKYEKISQDANTESIISQVRQFKTQFETLKYGEYIANAQLSFNTGDFEQADNFVKMAKNIKPESESDLKYLERKIELFITMPLDARLLYKAGKKVEQNTQKYWEAQFGDGIIMVYIPSGKGLPGYWMGKTEVSVTQYLKFVNETQTNEPEWQEKGSRFNLETGKDDYYRNQVGNDFPVVGITWENAKAYCQWLSRKTGMTFKLPSDDQWQKAAQGTDGRLYPWGGEKPGNNLANFSSLSTKTIKVDANPRGASPYGLLNMAGNVEEWCDNQTARGGSFYDNERSITCSSRRKYDPAERNNALGFRVCMVNKE